MNRPDRPAAALRSPGLCALASCALAFCAAACGDAPKKEAAPVGPEPRLQFVEQDAPFIVDWDSAQVARLTSALKGGNMGAVVVASRRGILHILPDCALGGIYTPAPMGMYRGALQVRRGDSAAMTMGVKPGALQQIATSENVPGDTLLDYRVVVVSRMDVSQSRKSAKLWELTERAPGACRGATHYIRAALAGAFERASDPAAPGGVQGGGPGQERMLPRGGVFEACLLSGNATDAACSAFLKIELAPIAPARVEIRLVSVSLEDQAASNIALRFRGKNNYSAETGTYASATAVPNWVMPAAEIAEDAPLLVEVVQQAKEGPRVLAAGEVTPSDLRKAVFDVELKKPNGAKAGAVHLAASEPAPAP